MLEPLIELGFHSKWFEFGLLPPGFFDKLIELYQTNEDPSTEHYRYHAFKAILSQREKLTDLELHQYLTLCSLDEDSNMAQSAILELLIWPNLADAQYHRLTQLPALQFPTAQKLIWRRKMRTCLQNDSLPDAIFQEILQSKDSTFQAELLSTAVLSSRQFEAFAAHGASRAVRNRAKARLAAPK